MLSCPTCRAGCRPIRPALPATARAAWGSPGSVQGSRTESGRRYQKNAMSGSNKREKVSREARIQAREAKAVAKQREREDGPDGALEHSEASQLNQIGAR